MPLMSFIMPARDGAAYISRAVLSIQDQPWKDWELIIIDDHSSDGTYDLAAALRDGDARIRLERNPGHGQVQAMNHGFGFAAGRFVKTVDCDDMLAPSFSDHLGALTSADATLHQAWLLDEKSGERRRFAVPAAFLGMSLEGALARIRVSPPRWAWTISMDLARRLFPLPADLPLVHEDVFIGLGIKKHAASTAYVDEPLYVYRQHAGQIYGGQFNYSRQAVTRKALAMIKVMDLVEASGIVEGLADPAGLLRPSRLYCEFLARPSLGLGRLLASRLGAGEKARIMVIRNMPRLAALASRRRSTRRAKGAEGDKG